MTKNVVGGSYGMTSYVSDGKYHSIPNTPPSAPATVTVGASTNNSVALSWTASAANTLAVASYIIYSGVSQVGTATTTSATISGLSLATSYTFTVAGVDSAGNIGPVSVGVVGTTTGATIPGAISSVTVSTVSSSSLSLSWTASSNATSYTITRNGSTIATGVSALTYTDTSLSSSTTYNYTVKGVNVNGAGSPTAGSGTTGASGGTATITGGTALSSSLVHGSAYTLTGSNLGTRPNYNLGGYTWQGVSHMHYLWCAFDQGNPSSYTYSGWNAVLGGMAPQWYDNTGAASTLPVPAIGTGNGPNQSGIYSGGPSAGGYYWQRSPNPSGAFSRFGGLHENIGGIAAVASYTGEYWSVKHRINGAAYEQTDGYNKSFRRSYKYISAPNDVETILYVTGSNASPSLLYGGGATGDPSGGWIPGTGVGGGNLYGSSPPNMHNWCRWENLVKANPGVSPGTVRTRINGTTLTWGNTSTPVHPSDIPAITASLTTFADSTYTPALSGGSGLYGMVWGSEVAVAAAYTHDFADVYHDFTPARVEISDGTYSEPQILSAWSPSGINFNFNKGQLSSGAGRTLTVYDASENIVATQTVTVA